MPMIAAQMDSPLFPDGHTSIRFASDKDNTSLVGSTNINDYHKHA
jgi:hypothetical protein